MGGKDRARHPLALEDGFTNGAGRARIPCRIATKARECVKTLLVLVAANIAETLMRARTIAALAREETGRSDG